jgi:toxin secretion/phage lysis holin
MTSLSSFGKMVCAGIAGLGTIICSFLGGWDMLIYALIVFVAIDYILGVACAWLKKQLSSYKGAKGFLKKISIFLVIGIAVVLDGLIASGNVNISILGGGPLRTLFILFYLSNEGISIFENLARLGVPFPDWIKDVLEQLKNNNKKS